MSASKENIPKAPLARSRAHHEMIGSSDGSRKEEEYHLPMSELMSDAAIKAHMRREYIVVCVYYAQLGERGEQFVQMFLTLRDDFLIPNLQYLAEIGRLPEEFDTEECNLSLIEKMLALPIKFTR